MFAKRKRLAAIEQRSGHEEARVVALGFVERVAHPATTIHFTRAELASAADARHSHGAPALV